MDDLEASLARTAHTLATQYPPDWSIPDRMRWYELPDRDIAEIVRYDLTTLRIMRGIYADRLAAIEDTSYYQRGDWGTWIDTTGPRGDKKTGRYSLDRCQCTHLLWWVDVMTHVHTVP